MSIFKLKEKYYEPTLNYIFDFDKTSSVLNFNMLNLFFQKNNKIVKESIIGELKDYYKTDKLNKENIKQKDLNLEFNLNQIEIVLKEQIMDKQNNKLDYNIFKKKIENINKDINVLNILNKIYNRPIESTSTDFDIQPFIDFILKN